MLINMMMIMIMMMMNVMMNKKTLIQRDFIVLVGSVKREIKTALGRIINNIVKVNSNDNNNNNSNRVIAQSIRIFN